MKDLPKNIIIWILVIVGKILLAMTVYNLNKISNNLDSLNESVNQLVTITTTQGVKIDNIEKRVDKHDTVFEEIFKQFYNNKK